MSKEDTTDFGFERVPLADKRRRVGEVFASVSSRYDLMNDLMSLGIHRAWKRFAVEVSELRPGQRVLDLAGGTGDLARQIIRRVSPGGSVVLADINAPMLEQGRQRLLDAGLFSGLAYVQADAEQLPFAAGSFDCICIAFGLRNVTNKDHALSSAYRALSPGGKLLVLEFSHPSVDAIEPIYDAYSFKILPWLGELVAKDREAYRYLAESIRVHPDQETLRAMMEQAGFERCGYFNLSAGIVAVHRGYKL